MTPFPPGFRGDAVRAGAPLTPVGEAKLERLLLRLREANESQNLTAILDPGDMVVDHLLDSLALAGVAARAGLPPGEGVRGVDIGTGAGFPGIPLAVAFPSSRWILVESEGMKCRWLETVLAELGIANAEVFRGRARELRHARKGLDGATDLVTARAVGDLGKLCREARGLLLCPKGPNLEPAEVALGDREARKSRLVPAGTFPMIVPGRERVCVAYRRETTPGPG